MSRTRLATALAGARPGQWPALDGLRAVAILLVISSHSYGEFLHAGGRPLFGPLWNGWIGVDLFFVLSGWLIGGALFREARATGAIDLAGFWIRRSFRIWPLYFLVTAFAAALTDRGRGLGLADVVPDLLLLTNYRPEHLARGSWSLASEEQFYLAAPIVLWLTAAWPVRRLRLALAAALLAAPLVRAAAIGHFARSGLPKAEAEWLHIYLNLHTHFDGLAIGALAATLQPGDLARRLPRALLAPGVVLALAAAIGGGVALLPLTVKYSVVGGVFGVAVLHAAHRAESVVSRLLSGAALRVVARLSYGMYLWYRFPLPYIARAVQADMPGAPAPLRFALVFAGAGAAAMAMATVTFALVERPMTDLGKRLAAWNVGRRRARAAVEGVLASR